jgi:2-methylcitrate dehydratase PrpD
MVSGPWIGQGVAAAAAYLRNLSPMQTAQAIAIAGASAPNLSAVGYSKYMGNHLKEGIPWATATGLSAVDLALAGYSGPIDLLDNPEVHDKAILLDGLGEQWAVSDIYFKPYSCCRWAHAAMDAALYLQNEHNFLHSDVIGIEISTFAWALNLNNERRPRTLESAQYSIPFCVALLLTQGQDAFLPMRQDSLDDPDTLSLADRVSLKIVGRYDIMFPKRVPAQVKISLATGDLLREVLEPLGEQSNPMSLVQMNRKFSTVADRVLSSADKQKMAAAISAFRMGKFTDLQNALGNPLILPN